MILCPAMVVSMREGEQPNHNFFRIVFDRNSVFEFQHWGDSPDEIVEKYEEEQFTPHTLQTPHPSISIIYPERLKENTDDAVHILLCLSMLPGKGGQSANKFR